MKVLLTGASGFLGCNVLKYLESQDISTVVIGRSIPAITSRKNFIQIDLLEQNKYVEWINKIQATHLLHLAWYTEHGKYWTSPLNLRWIEASIRLIEAFCEAGGKKVVAAGTCAEYDWTYGYCRESSTPLNPNTLYGRSKDATRRIMEAICDEYKVSSAWGRIFQPFGQGEDSRRLIPQLLEVFQGKRPSFGVNGSAYRDFIHVADVAEGIVRLLQDDASGIYNISSGKPIKISDVVLEVAHVFNLNPQVVLNHSIIRDGEPNFLVGDNQKLISLGWQPKHSLREFLIKEHG